MILKFSPYVWDWIHQVVVSVTFSLKHMVPKWCEGKNYTFTKAPSNLDLVRKSLLDLDLYQNGNSRI